MRQRTTVKDRLTPAVVLAAYQIGGPHIFSKKKKQNIIFAGGWMKKSEGLGFHFWNS